LAWITQGAPFVLAAAEGAFQAQLVWGTNGEKPKDKPLKELDPKLQERLKGVFKWKNYYEVNRKPLPVPKAGAQKVKLSDKCELQVQDLGSSRIEIRLFGEGVLVVKKVQSVIPGEAIVLGGFDKNDTAWFVVVTPPK
jgi:hypothetical protein